MHHNCMVSYVLMRLSSNFQFQLMLPVCNQNIEPIEPSDNQISQRDEVGKGIPNLFIQMSVFTCILQVVFAFFSNLFLVLPCINP